MASALRALVFLALVPSPLSHAAATTAAVVAVGEEDEGQSCAETGVPEIEHSMIQMHGLRQKSKVADEASSTAQFLMQASFGPTKAEVETLTSFQDWMEEQMASTWVSHREYYRQRVSPRYTTEFADIGVEGTPCSKGSRWHRHAITKQDKHMSLDVVDDGSGNRSILIDGSFRSNVHLGALPSRWVGLLPVYAGEICDVGEERVGGAVVVAAPDCSSGERKEMPNPALWMVSGPKAERQLFDSLLPGVLVKAKDSEEVCGLSEVVGVDGEFYRFDPRLRLQANTPKEPKGDWGTCVRKTPSNEQSCLLAPTSPKDGRHVRGLTAVVFVRSLTPQEAPIAQVLDPNINHPVDSAWLGFPNDNFVVYWTGTLSITAAGSYTFFLGADDGAVLTIAGNKVVDHSWFHRDPENTGTVDLPAGRHAILVKYTQGWGPKRAVLKYKGADTGDLVEVVPESALSTPKPTWEGCFARCGSPGEVGNDVSAGHHFSFMAKNMFVDKSFDNRYGTDMRSQASRTSVWLMNALFANDQLRQRMAWALMQIIVVSATGSGNQNYVEEWLNFYDILLRNSFGSYKDILREVTYNPVMGDYLTHVGSTSYDQSGTFPNENYAREIMQLFTIGLFKLHTNGSQVLADGQALPTYSNKHIMNFARALTGFKKQETRRNIEFHSRLNMIDPMQLDVLAHDLYPKPDLHGGFLGDEHPFCEDVSVPHVDFLKAGAEYEVHYARAEVTGEQELDILELVPESQLYQLLCAPGEEGACAHPFKVVLRKQVPCTGIECDSSSVQFVQVGHVVYKHLAPVCVHRSFWPSTANDTGVEPAEPIKRVGGCLLDQGWGGSVNLGRGGQGPVREAECLSKCRANGGKGCELRNSRRRQHCMMHSRPVLGANSQSGRICWSLPGSGLQGYAYMRMPSEQASCPDVARITSVAECQKAHESHGLPVGKFWVGSRKLGPYGCSHNEGRMFYNNRKESSGNWRYDLLCRAHVNIDSDGDLVQANGHTKYQVKWLNDAKPALGIYLVRTEGEKVSLIGAQGSFKNPPVFLRQATEPGAERAIHAEVESLLEHLVTHPNTGPFVGKRLIQRLTTSNPSPEYVADVAAAFRSGEYDGHVYSGKSGDLAATLAAVLMHPEARGSESDTAGLLREPMLKFVHLMRAMEYQDESQGPIAMRSLIDEIGQHPFEAPSVFNYYLPDFVLPEAYPETEPEPEAESEPEPEAESEPEAEPENEMAGDVKALVAPEFMIFTPPFFMGYLNSMSSLIKTGVSRCGVGSDTGITKVCPQGQLAWRAIAAGANKEGATEEILEGLDVLLTGGRLTADTKAMVKEVYQRAEPGKELQAAQQAIVMTAEFNTLGKPRPKSGRRMLPNLPQLGEPKNYKAMVLLFLAGGADTWNLLVPKDCTLYNEYKRIRSDLALLKTEMTATISTGFAPEFEGECTTFGIHKAFGYLRELYTKGEAAFVTNVGNLVMPTSKQQYRDASVERCQGMFSHSDQQRGAQDLVCQDRSELAGAGGRIADALARGSQAYHTSSFSLSGAATWSKGIQTEREIVTELGSRTFHEYEQWRRPVENITSQQFENVYSEAYIEAFLRAIQESEELGRFLSGTELLAPFEPDSKLKQALTQVLKLIKSRDLRKAERDFFFVEMGGWDHHQNMKMNLQRKFEDINDALGRFVNELKEQQVWSNVVLATASEFGRTLDSNGGGSDHAWAGQHFVIGGSLSGGKVFNKYPPTLENNELDLGRGRLIPQYPWESMMVPIAKWMGLDDEDVGTVFPNAGNFNKTHIIANLFGS